MKILVVDREEDIGAALDILEKTPGNEVISAHTGQQGLDLVEGQHVDLVITEVILEPMNGFTLRNKMENRHPGVRTIFLSGYDLSPYAEHTAGHEIVPKPATPQKLFPAIARALGFGVAQPHQPASTPFAPQPPAAPPQQTELPLATPAPTPVATPAPIATPAAVPRATPAPAATPVAVPRATPVPAATPVATPVATPRPTPAASPAATPAVVPQATPAPAATPVAAPRATPAPAATPVATPRATPAPAATPVAVPQATPTVVPQATPAPAATPVAVPRATPAPVATPVPIPRATPAPAATPVAIPRPAGAPVAVPKPSPAPTAVPVHQPPAPAATPVATPRAIPAPAATPVATPRVTPAAVPQSTAAPVAVPKATPAPAASPVAIPRATPAPVATPAATPRATPAATPVAVPKATPDATPVATPRATPAPVATPRATPSVAPIAVPKATPAATPVATPRATPAATPVATPRATPTAIPRAAAAPVAVPKPAPTAATPTATPRPSAVPVPQPSLVPAKLGEAGTLNPQPAAPTAPDSLINKTFGSYEIKRRLGTGKWGPVYLAIQVSMNRPVAMELLGEEFCADETARQNFVATARAKAAVAHPHILAVYEADQADGRLFYTHEYVDGATLAQLLARGDGLTEQVALQTIKYVSQGLAHLHLQRIAHAIPDGTDIYIGIDGLPRLSNVALPGDTLPAVQEEIHAIGNIVRHMLPGGQAQDPGLQAMLIRMAITTQAGFQSWPALFQAIQAIEPKVIPVDAFKLSAQDKEAIRAVEEARKRQKRQVIISIAGLFVFTCVAIFAIWYQYLRPTVHDYSDVMVQIPAGPFIYQEGETRTLPTFYIDKYEVTMAEYQKFLDYLTSHGNPTTYDSQLQPAGRSHVPRDWDIYYRRASSSFSGYHNVKGVPITADCPVFNVDFFDAYAYAAWKGRRLPTDQEWEKAARGTSANIYPWGNTWDPKKLNSGADYQSDPPPGYKPAVDGYTWWAPVDAFPDDRSPYGVIGMGGNVSEWTSTWDPSKTTVVIRGGNYKYGAERAKTTSIIKAYPQTATETLGFRTAADTPPAK